MKLNTLLAKTEHSGSQFKALLKDFLSFFSHKQGDFRGVKKTYSMREGTNDEPSMRGNVQVVTTVDEKLDWLVKNNSEYIDNLFSLEASNATGIAKAQLVVENVDFGKLSSLELLRLKTLLTSSELEDMYAKIPVRSDTENWVESKDDAYVSRVIFETEQMRGTKKTIHKEPYILSDPNIQFVKDTSRYQPVQATRDTVIELGDYTVQQFSGEWSHHQRAELLRRRSAMLSAVITALKEANDTEAIPSNLSGKAFFTYLHTGKSV